MSEAQHEYGEVTGVKSNDHMSEAQQEQREGHWHEDATGLYPPGVEKTTS
jgi:hypothetical protein